jgi:hypothetical protein
VIEVGAGPVGPFIDTLKQRGAARRGRALRARGTGSAEDDRRLRLAVFSGLARLAARPSS